MCKDHFIMAVSHVSGVSKSVGIIVTPAQCLCTWEGPGFLREHAGFGSSGSVHVVLLTEGIWLETRWLSCVSMLDIMSVGSSG